MTDSVLEGSQEKLRSFSNSICLRQLYFHLIIKLLSTHWCSHLTKFSCATEIGQKLLSKLFQCFQFVKFNYACAGSASGKLRVRLSRLYSPDRIFFIINLIDNLFVRLVICFVEDMLHYPWVIRLGLNYIPCNIRNESDNSIRNDDHEILRPSANCHGQGHVR